MFFDPPNFTFPFGAHGCEVEVDRDTGKVEITGYIAVDDCGNVINPMIVDGQVHGGVAHGIGQALYEEAVYDAGGQLLTGTLVDYIIPSAVEIPHIDTDRTVTPSPTNPLGVKGIGEAGTIAATPAVVSAVCDAHRRPPPRHAAPAGDGLERDAEGRCGMIPRAFEYERPGSVADAAGLLRKHGDGARVLAGGHSLVPMMKLRLAAPDALIDIGGIHSLRGISDAGSHIVIGALTRHADVAASDLVRSACPILAQAAAGVGDMQVRNRGTIGGSLAQADPHGDLPAVLLALDGEVSVEGPDGTRTIAARDLFVEFLTTSLKPDEILTGVRVPKAAHGAYVKFNRRAQDWAIVGVAAVVDGASARIALTGVGAAARAGRGRRARVHRRERRRGRRAGRRGPHASGRHGRLVGVPQAPRARAHPAGARGGGGVARAQRGAATRAVVFDVGETLLDESRAWTEWAGWLGVSR